MSTSPLSTAPSRISTSSASSIRTSTHGQRARKARSTFGSTRAPKLWKVSTVTWPRSPPASEATSALLFRLGPRKVAGGHLDLKELTDD